MHVKHEKLQREDSTGRKSSSAERNAYMKALWKLSQQEEIIEKGFAASVASIRIDSNELQDILNDYKNTTGQRKMFIDTLHKNLEEIINEMRAAKRVTEDPEEMQKLDVTLYKQKLLKLSQRICEFKQFCSTETLREEQMNLEAELQEFQFNIQKYGDIRNINVGFNNSKVQKKINTDYKDAENFHSLIARTGHTENWAEEDHLFFLKTRKTCNGIRALVTAIQTKCPDLSTEAIVNHESWYRVYQRLREKQKATVREWRKQKESERSGRTEEEKNDTGVSLRAEFQGSEAFNSKERTRTRVKIAKEFSLKNDESETRLREMEDKKELIRNWRAEKERKRIMDSEEIQTRMRMKRKFQEIQRERRLKKVQAALSEYRRRKSAEADLKKYGRTNEGKCKCDMGLIKAFRKQDEEYARRRRKLISGSKERCKEIPRKNSEAQKIRSDSTLFNSTKVWREKCKIPAATEKLSTGVLFIKDVPNLCSKWRNEESIELKNSFMDI